MCTIPHLHLLVDDDEIDARWHVTRMIARPEARTADPVLRPDRAWEGRAAGLSGTVLRDGPNGIYRLWYRSFHDGRPESDRNFLNYAESSDGLVWEKPALRLIEYEGDPDTNIVYRPRRAGLRAFESNGVIIDETGAPERRYKLVAHHGFEDKSRNGLFGLFSPDGLRWTATDRPLLPGAGDRHGALKDPATGEYVVFTRSPRYKVRAHGRDDPDTAPLPYKRIVGRTTSRDFINWSPFRTVLRNDDFDAPGAQFYSISPFRYGNRLLAFVDVYDTDVERMWVTLASSLDGIHWNRPLRAQPILDLGRGGALGRHLGERHEQPAGPGRRPAALLVHGTHHRAWPAESRRRDRFVPAAPRSIRRADRWSHGPARSSRRRCRLAARSCTSTQICATDGCASPSPMPWRHRLPGSA